MSYPRTSTAIAFLGVVLTTIFSSFVWISWRFDQPYTQTQIVANWTGCGIAGATCLFRLFRWNVITWEWRQQTHSHDESRSMNAWEMFLYAPIWRKLIPFAGILGIMTATSLRQYFSADVRSLILLPITLYFAIVFGWLSLEDIVHLCYHALHGEGK